MCRRLRHLAIVTLFACVGCGSADPLRVTGIQVGRSLNADGTIATHATTFVPNDNIYLSVRTAGSGSGTISVRWLYAGRVVDEPKKEVSYRDVAATQFQLKSPQGFPIGEYAAEVFLDGKPVGKQAFRVETRR
jgi:hypothetical protein